MKIIHLNAFADMGGAARSALRAQVALKAVGCESRVLVQRLGDCTVPDVLGSSGLIKQTATNVRMHLDALPVRFYPNRPMAQFAPAYVPDLLKRQIEKLNPDIIHLHWLGAGFCRIESLASFGRPIVWTLHDSWAFTGGCYLPEDCLRYQDSCGNCPVLGSQRDVDLSRKVWSRKKDAWKNLDLHIVTPSRWLAKCAESSSLFRNTPVTVIPNGLDLAQFTPFDREEARRLLSLPADKKLILFGAVNSTSDKNKGYHLLQPALQQMVDEGVTAEVELVVVGASNPENSFESGLPEHRWGHVHDDHIMKLLYSAADVFVAPSMQENLSNMVMEALACGTPCVAFNVGGMPDMIEHGITGYLANPFDTDELGRNIRLVLGADCEGSLKMLSGSRKKVEEEFSQELFARRMMKLYHAVLENRVN